MAPWTVVALVYLSQCVAGLVVLRWLWKGEPLPLLDRAARALLLGPAAIAVQMIAMSLVAISFSLAAVLVPWWIAAIVLWLRRGGRGAEGTPAPASSSAPELAPAGASPSALVARASLAVLALLLFCVLTALGLRTPVFESDPINNFALPARIFETQRGLGGDVLAELNAIGHVEYPPLVALNEALVFMAAGEQRLRAVMPFFALPWLALQWLVISAACARLRVALALPVCLIAMLLPHPYALGTAGLADLRLAACVLLLALEGRRLMLVPGAASAARYVAAATACALTKNEGLVVAAVAMLPLAGLTVRRRLSWRAGAVSMLVVLAACTVWVAYLALHDVHTGHWEREPAGQLSPGLAGRFGLALEGFRSFSFPSIGYTSTYGVLWHAAVAAAVIGLLRRAARRETAALLLVLAVHVGLYALLMAIVSQPVNWTLQASGLRMFTHMIAWPILLLVAALAGIGEPRAASDVPRETLI
jgi:hypothetical protein